MAMWAGVLAGKATRKAQEKNQREGKHVPYGVYEAFLKRPLDTVLALAGLSVLSPLIGVCALLVRLKLGRPVLFTQKRPGLEGKLFLLYKFRTMTDGRREDGSMCSDEERLTPFGKVLRAASLDELPELWNIFRGDMSFVGPRPLLPDYLSLYSRRQSRRHEVKPGLTGLAQVNGRNGLSWEERLETDVCYTKKVTFLGDLRILIKTLIVVLKKEGISSGTSATMEPFTGSVGKVELARDVKGVPSCSEWKPDSGKGTEKAYSHGHIQEEMT